MFDREIINKKTVLCFRKCNYSLYSREKDEKIIASYAKYEAMTKKQLA